MESTSAPPVPTTTPMAATTDYCGEVLNDNTKTNTRHNRYNWKNHGALKKAMKNIRLLFAQFRCFRRCFVFLLFKTMVSITHGFKGGG